jgi:plastocyanin
MGFGRRNRWQHAVTLAGAALAVASLAVAVTAGDAESAAVGCAFVLGTLLVVRGLHRFGSLVLAALWVNLLVWLVPATYSNVAHAGEVGAIAVPGVMVAIAIIGLAALGGWAADADERSLVGLVGLMALAVVAVVVVPRLTDVGSADRAVLGDLRLSARSMDFSTEHLEASPGTVGVVLDNHDLFWHTFSVPDLDVDLRVPVRGTRRVTFDALAGTYEFVCTIPGHERAGMKGQLVVR